MALQSSYWLVQVILGLEAYQKWGQLAQGSKIVFFDFVVLRIGQYILKQGFPELVKMA